MPKGSDDAAAGQVVAEVERLAAAAERRWQLLAEARREIGLDPDRPVSPSVTRGPRERALEIRDHARAFLLPRARDLDAPLLVAILGPTGSGKSTLINTLVGSPVSEAGVLRPTTRIAIAVGSAADLDRAVDDGALSALQAGQLEPHTAGVLPGLVMVDAPDVDSVEHGSRALADHLLEVADLGVFVTTATRYADRVPWDVLERAEQRGLGLVVVINRMPAGPDATAVLEDLEALLAGTELRVREVVTVADGAISEDGMSLQPGAVEPLRQWLETLSADAVERRTLAAGALADALHGVAPLAREVADDLEQEVRARQQLLEHLRDAYAGETESMLDRLFSGSFLRAEIIRNWHSFVGADQVTRFFSDRIGQLRGAVSAVLRRGPKAPVAEVQQGATDDITALVVNHAAEAARRSAEWWSNDPEGALIVAEHPELWSSSAGIEAATRQTVDEWLATIAGDVAARGEGRRGAARLAALGVNAVAVTLMLVTFSSTGGLTGVEAGIAAGTAFLNQKLLNALFGEAAVREMVSAARKRLSEALEELMADERRRFEDRLGDTAERTRLADELRSLAA